MPPTGLKINTISIGSLDGDTNLKLSAHIFVVDKGDDYNLEKDLPQYPQGGDKIPMPTKEN
ncbi:MAG: hypothetical protein JKY27_05635 [Magnetovibrio sp.]|nr:hypothetical protein [Magnetovibrio sp.]